MKFTITSETLGTEVLNSIVTQLAASELKISANPEEIKTQVLNKEGKWVDFDPAKVRFVFSK